VKLGKENKITEELGGRGTGIGRLEEVKCPLLNLMGILTNGHFVHLDR